MKTTSTFTSKNKKFITNNLRKLKTYSNGSILMLIRLKMENRSSHKTNIPGKTL